MRKLRQRDIKYFVTWLQCDRVVWIQSPRSQTQHSGTGVVKLQPRSKSACCLFVLGWVMDLWGEQF